MGAGGFHGRVRDGIGCGPPAKATRSSRSMKQLSVSVVSFQKTQPGRVSVPVFWLDVKCRRALRSALVPAMCRGVLPLVSGAF
jgi:hypothetical protein